LLFCAESAFAEDCTSAGTKTSFFQVPTEANREI